MQYRIVKTTWNPFNTTYEVQKKVLWFWVTCEPGWASHSTLEDAKKHLAIETSIPFTEILIHLDTDDRRF